MKHKTEVDTLAIQVNFSNEEECDAIHSGLVSRLEEFKYIDLDDDGYEIQYKYKRMATIEKGSYSYTKSNK